MEGLRSAEKPRAGHRLGLEHEKFVYPAPGTSAPPRAVPYEGASGIGALLERLAATGGYTPFRETPTSPVIACRGEATVSLEPGGQLELSGSPWRTAREAHAENLAHLAEARAAAGSLGLSLVALATGRGPGARHALDAQVALPGDAPHAGERGALALNMMLMTSTGQVSLDWESEEDCVRKTVTTARLTPLLVALYANSPLVEGRDTGLVSFRSKVWTGWTRRAAATCAAGSTAPSPTAPTWTGRWMRRSSCAAAASTLPQAHLPPAAAAGFEGQPADMADWTDHLSTLFPEVRLKKVMEVRGRTAWARS